MGSAVSSVAAVFPFLLFTKGFCNNKIYWPTVNFPNGLNMKNGQNLDQVQ